MRTFRLESFLWAFVAVLFVSCSNKDSTLITTPNPAPKPVPTAAPTPGTSDPESDLPWETVQLFRSYTTTTDCGSIELKIAKAGGFDATHCDQVSQGLLSEEEKIKLGKLVDAALNETLPNVCTQSLKLDADYVTIQPTPASPDIFRKFDPDGACYSGGEAQVKALRAELRKLRASITGYTPSTED